MALDAISTPTLVAEVPFAGRSWWSINGYDTDLSTAIEIKAAPGAGKSLYITHVIMTCNDADSFPQLQDEDATVLFGRFFPLLGTAGGGFVIDHKFERPLKVTTNKALELKAAAAGNVSIFIEGATAEG